MALPDGLYDLLLTEGLARSLATLDPISADVLALKGGAAQFLAEVITRQLGAILDDVVGDDADKPRHQLELVNDLLLMLRQRLSAGGSSAASLASADVVDLVASPLRVLRAVKRDQQFPASPEIGLAVPWLITAGKGSPSLLQEIRRELASSDQVDILVSFITVSGVRKLQDVLQQIMATGGSNGSRVRLWKLELSRLAQETGLTIRVRHFPPGTSKWNKIEHRLFSFITMNWRGRPLISHAVIVNLIASTKTRSGLTVRSEIDTNSYPKGLVVSDIDFDAIRLIRDEFHGDWNYAIEPLNNEGIVS